ncbi:MAG: transcription-repair coupling factor [Chloroherpetonaceae bacterium]|nr:transcription-repair coupling factor [Chloroherpetonaceae bacterium]MDW8437666.1 transcription-repair coupling factor [Chloroherpetonaceae bacterium]
MNPNHIVAATDAIRIETEKFRLAQLLSTISASSPFQSLVAALQNPTRAVAVSGLRGSLASIVVAELFKRQGESLLLVCQDDDIDRYENDLPILLGKDALIDFVAEPSLALAALLSGEKRLVVSTPAELCRKVQPRTLAQERILTIKQGECVGYERLEAFLSRNGFVRKDFVEAEGDFAIRGSIVDVFSFGASDAVRIEFFGDEAESIRAMDVNSQLSTEKLSETRIVANLVAPSPESESLLDYLRPESLVVMDDAADYGADVENGEFFKKDDVVSRLGSFRRVEIRKIGAGDVEFGARSQPKFNSNFSEFGRAIRRDAESGKTAIVASTSQKEIDDIVDFLQVEAERDDNGEAETREIVLRALPENFYEGFVFEGVSLYAESDVFGKLHLRKRHKKRKRRQISLRELRALKVGDYVVHEDYGVGAFMGLERVKVGNSEQEAVLIQYDKGDSLYVNLQSLHLLSKHSSAEGAKPALSRLGSDKWKAQKERIKKRLKDIARNLIELYAKRKATKGFAHKPDSVWQREFEAAFIFEETPDQLAAIEAVKADMMSEAPMDRLICGDAGFGKTEVAMRAAFKAVESGKQVAVLVPTTILAHQHYNSFKLRFQNFPVRIEVLSRFVPPKELKRIVADIREGKVDIAIGTHRLVSKDVAFKDLGLLIIDEEQHFGVATKEKLREQFPTVDTLTLTATPIPRTLQFSMMGARDLSIISTPPKNRQPIETIVCEYDEAILQEAILRELGRGGQVFVLNNRIESLDAMGDVVKRLAPRARVGIAHGQMPSKDLEQTMMDFLQKEINVLICTTIIESGLDISNVNTIIINRADTFGLSDLYQLRGRVGRSDRKAYCYLFTPPPSTLSQDALQRLAAIEEFTELGSGFNVALRDLDIRGAGNLLGAEQSGFVYELGFDLYQKILEEAVAELKSTEFQNLFKEAERRKEADEKPCEASFFFSAFIPSFYVESASERFALYEKLSKANSLEDIDRFERELEDRFGKMPDEARYLVAVARLRVQATRLSLARLEIGERKCVFIFPDGETHQAFYQSETFGKILDAIQSSAMKKYQPAFKNEKRLKLEISFERSCKDSPERAIEAAGDVLRLMSS